MSASSRPCTMSKETSSNPKSNKLIRSLKSPFRILHWARDFYENSLMGCARGTARMSSAMPRSRSHGFPRSALTSSDEDIRDLIRAASRGGAGLLSSRVKDGVVVPRSQSVAVTISRIDEEGPCNFDDVDVKLGPRSRSCAVVTERKRVRVIG